MMFMNLKNIAILNIKVADYRCIISEIRKNEAISVIQNADLNEKRGTLQNTKSLFLYIKMSREYLTFEDIMDKLI